jgi:hypothetical protein
LAPSQFEPMPQTAFTTNVQESCQSVFLLNPSVNASN